MRAKKTDGPRNRCPSCGEAVQRRWIACPKCGLSPISSPPSRGSIRPGVTRSGAGATGKNAKGNGRYAELKSMCQTAQQSEEQALLGIPHDLRAPCPAELNPYRPENLDLWREAAELGIPVGKYLLAKCLTSNGHPDEGRRWMADAAASGCRPAKRDLGEALLDLGQCSKGVKLLLQAAEGGDALANEVLAYHYESGEGLPRSTRKYRTLLKKAAALGNKRAEIVLSDCRVVRATRGQQ